jgi:hypothetical protein
LSHAAISLQPDDLSPDALLYEAVEASVKSFPRGRRGKARRHFEALMRLLTSILLSHTEVQVEDVKVETDMWTEKRDVRDTIRGVRAICGCNRNSNGSLLVDPFAVIDNGKSAFTLLKNAWRRAKWAELLEAFEGMSKPVQDGAVIVSLVNSKLVSEKTASGGLIEQLESPEEAEEGS